MKGAAVQREETAYDDSRWPIVRVTPPPRGGSAEAFRRHFDYLDLLFARREPFALLVDTRGYPPLSALERSIVAELMRKHDGTRAHMLRARAVVISSSIGRGVFTAVNWLARTPYPIAAFADEASALRWLHQFFK